VLTRAGAGEDAAETGDLDVTSELSIEGNGASVDAGGSDRAFDVLADGELQVEYLNVGGGAPPAGESGGAFRSTGTLVIDRSRIESNVVAGMGASGGGVFNDQGKLLVKRSELEGNTATRAGGGIEANLGRTALDEVALTRDSTGAGPGNGGGLHLTGAGTVNVDRSDVARNAAAAEGGGLWNSATGTMTVTDTRIRRNQAPAGRNVFNDGGTFTIDGRPVPPTI